MINKIYEEFGKLLKNSKIIGISDALKILGHSKEYISKYSCAFTGPYIEDRMQYLQKVCENNKKTSW